MNTFAQLLFPFDVAEFFAHFWGRTPLYIDGASSKFDSLPNMQDLPSLLGGRLSGSRWTKGYVHSAQASFIDRAGNIRHIPAIPSMWPDLFNAGVSLCFGAVDQYSEDLNALTRGIAATTRLPGTIVTTCYLTPPFSGSGMHFDSQNAFFMQVSGKKHWKISASPAWQDAPTNLQLSLLGAPKTKAFLESMGIVIASPQETRLQEVTLSPGDTLYLPPGCWHDGYTSDSHSFHYTLTFMPLDSWHLFAAYLRRSYFGNALLRRDLRYTEEAGQGGRKNIIEAAIIELRNTVNKMTPEDLEEFFMEVSSMGGPLPGNFVQP
jgi:ribosomal protein L16 Arg81 hydroxylase